MNIRQSILAAILLLSAAACNHTADQNTETRDTLATDTAPQQPVIKDLKRRTLQIDSLTIELMPIKGGTFLMGAQRTDSLGCNFDPNATAAEGPVRQVDMPSFYLAQTEMTRGILKIVLQDSLLAATLKGNDSLPATQLTHGQVISCIEALNKKLHQSGQLGSGESLRLPTEAEWEYAAHKGGWQDYCNNLDSLMVHAVTGADVNIQPVGRKRPDLAELQDMIGNVAEWVADWHTSAYNREETYNPQGATDGGEHIYRGGDCNMPATAFSIHSRSHCSPDHNSPFIGFRVAMTAQ